MTISEVTESKLYKAGEAVLLFYSASHWSPEKAQTWKNITGHNEATTKILCDTVRLAMLQAIIEGD